MLLVEQCNVSTNKKAHYVDNVENSPQGNIQFSDYYTTIFDCSIPLLIILNKFC